MKKSAHQMEAVLNLIWFLRELMDIRMSRTVDRIRLEEAPEVERMIDEGCPNFEADPW